MIKKTDVVYIAGSMRGIPNFNYPRFFEVERLLKEIYGCLVLNPAHAPVGLSIRQYAALALQQVNICDALVLLPGWNKSRGAAAEVVHAIWIGCSLYEIDDHNGLHKTSVGMGEN